MSDKIAMKTQERSYANIQLGKSTSGIRLPGMGTRQNWIHGNNMSFGITDMRSIDMQKYAEDYRRQVNTEMRNHIKRVLTRAIQRTRNQLHYNSKRTWGRPLAEVLGGSLQFGIKPGANLFQSEFIVGSYDADEAPPIEPTGVRGSGMNKNDKSLTELYENAMGAFRQKGLIGKGKGSGMIGYIRPGERADWKADEESAEGIVYSEPGFGSKMKRVGKGLPVVRNQGWVGLRMMDKLHTYVREMMNETSTLRANLERITASADTKPLPQGQTTLAMYSSLKGQ